MTSSQRIIKYAATALALLLAFSIIGSIVGAIAFVGSFLSGADQTGSMQDYPISGEVTRLDLEVGGADLEIRCGDAFSVQSNLNDLTVQIRDTTLFIEEEDHWGISANQTKLILTLPRETVLSAVTIVTGAGRLTAENLSTEKFSMELGAGAAVIEYLDVKGNADIQSGAGGVRVNSGSVSDLKLEMGVGELVFCAKFLGNSELELGVGSAKITLLGDRDDYSVKVNKGLGEAKIDGEAVQQSTVIGTGDARVNVDGGVGSVLVQYESEQ